MSLADTNPRRRKFLKAASSAAVPTPLIGAKVPLLEISHRRTSPTSADVTPLDLLVREAMISHPILTPNNAAPANAGARWNRFTYPST